jgi:hypothetical protein
LDSSWFSKYDPADKREKYPMGLRKICQNVMTVQSEKRNRLCIAPSGAKEGRIQNHELEDTAEAPKPSIQTNSTEAVMTVGETCIGQVLPQSP